MTPVLNSLKRSKPMVEAHRVESDFDVDLAKHNLKVDDLPVFEETSEAVPQHLAAVPAAALTPGSLLSEEFRMLRAKVRGIGEQRPFHCIGLVSATAGEGKTTVTLGLAMAIAQEPDRRVLVIEADVRKPSIDSYLGLSRVSGLGDWLEEAQGTVTVRRLVPQGFFLLSAGRSSLQRPELLGSDRMGRLLEAARRYFDFVVVDCPPLVPVADSVILQDLLDGFLFVVRARHSPRETLQRAISNIKADRIQGVVFNDYKDLLPGYYNYGYRQYGPWR
jgi:capsular exopolysaccharide synthesis family protein